jgi:formylglycine-generating enzyme required for sulfatase activity
MDAGALYDRLRKLPPERACFEQPLEKGAPAPVGGRPAGKSPFGCQDMAGNVWEWCLDAWRESYGTATTKVVNPCHQGDRGAPRVVRGGSWFFGSWILRCAYRFRDHPRARLQRLGFRVVCRGSRQLFGW